jgi:hypothetical protein
MPICRRQIPQPGYDPNALKPLLFHILFHLLHVPHRIMQVDSRDSDEPVRIRACVFRDLLVGEYGFAGSVPCAEADLMDPFFVHKGDELGGRAV